ncbi:MAG: S10 family peptidase [Vicinamibacterales bacterium]
MRIRPFVAAIAMSCLAIAPCAIASAQQRPGAPGGRPGAPGAQGENQNQNEEGVEPVENVSTTQHTITIDGKAVPYTARAGTMIIRDDAGKPKGTVFYIAYTADKADAATRPVTFFFNGGPGSASIWLDMGIMSPRHPNMGPNGTVPAPPYDLVDNPNSPLDVTDLVQVDAMMTGYSRPGVGVKASDFTGAQNDIKMFGQFIRNYLDKYDRWASPKYLFGESYGTFRSAGLASELQANEGIELNGIMLLGTVLDFQLISPSSTNDIGYATFLPTYTASAWYHKKLPAALQGQSLKQVVDQSRQYAFGDYLTALAKGNALTQPERTAVAQKLAQLTGLSPQFILDTNLRIDAGMFRTELLRDERLMLGRYDTRLTGINGNPASQRQDYDPSDVAPSSAFMSAFMRYLHEDLKYTSDLQYYLGGHTGRWDYTGVNAGFGGGYPSESESLRLAMAKDPYLHVMVGAGYYDTATPFANAEYTFSHFGFDKTYTDRVQFKYFESGHMAYLNQASAKQLKADIASFINGTERAPELEPRAAGRK